MHHVGRVLARDQSASLEDWQKLARTGEIVWFYNGRHRKKTGKIVRNSHVGRAVSEFWLNPCMLVLVATGQLATEYLPGYLGSCGDIWDNTQSPQVPILSPTRGNLRVLFAARLSTACKSVFELSSSSFSFASQHQLF